MKKFLLILLIAGLTSCVSTKNTIRNIDDSAPIPKLNGTAFVLTEFSTDDKYGFDPDYPVNVFYVNAKDENLNATRYLNALAGPKGEKLFYRKVDSCCPFPSKRNEMGAGFVDIYELSWVGLKKPLRLYVNIYERGQLQVPVGLGLKK